MTYGVTPPRRLEAMQLRDGRALAWAEWGPECGLPVLFCTGAGTSRRLGFGAHRLKELDIRLIAIDRPGLGASDPHPFRTLDTWVEDVRELVLAQEWHDVTTIGFSLGAPFALALGGRGIAEAVAIVSGLDDLAHPALEANLHPDVARMVTAARSDAAAFEHELARVSTAEGLWDLIVGTSDARDLEVYTCDVFAAAFRRALEEGFARGPHGHARDLAIAYGAWPFAPESITVPVGLWYGARDRSPVHSPDFGETLASRLPRATRTVFADEGGSLLWTRSREILAWLVRQVIREPVLHPLGD